MQDDEFASLIERVGGLSLTPEESNLSQQSISDISDISELSERIHDDQPQKLSPDRLIIAGIDFGTAVSRVTLAHAECRAYFDVKNPDCPLDFANEHASFEFPAVVDVSTNRMGYGALAAGISIKTLMYELVRREDPSSCNEIYTGVNFGQLEERGVSDANLSVLRDKGRLRELVVTYFKKIRHAMMICCLRNNLFYESVSVTIPTIWNVTHFKRLFIGILADVFTFIPIRNIFLIPKTEAIGCTITNGITIDQVRHPHGDVPYPDEIMVIDFGRHAVHGTNLTLVWDDTEEHRVNSNPDFFASEQSWGMLGGMEYYAQVTEEAIRDSIATNPIMANHRLKEKCVTELMADFRQKCAYLGRNPFTLNSSLGDWHSEMRAPHLWDVAFSQPLELIHQQMRERARAESPTIVCLTGSSFRNTAVWEATLSEVRKYAEYGWMHFTPFNDRFLAVRGAAWAVRQRKDVRTFLKNSNLEFSFHNINEPQKPYTVRLGQVTTLNLYKTSFLRMTCEPYAFAPGKNVYDLAQLGLRGKGHYLIRLEVDFDEEKQQHTLVLEEREFRWKTGAVVSCAKWAIPMYYDVGRRIPLVDDLDFDLRRLEQQRELSHYFFSC